MELKTLKDLKIKSQNAMFEYGADEQLNIIKKEAIQWIKKFQDIDISYPNSHDLEIKWIKHFFNIEEKDLK